jgi:hypothetical protein
MAAQFIAGVRVCEVTSLTLTAKINTPMFSSALKDSETLWRYVLNLQNKIMSYLCIFTKTFVMSVRSTNRKLSASCMPVRP